MAVPPELMAALQGAAGADTGGPPGPDAQVGGPDTGGPPGPDNMVGGPEAGLPPEIMAGIEQDAAGGGAPPGGQATDPVEILKSMLASADQYRSQEDDEQNKLLIEKVTTMIQQILANEQSQTEAAAGVTPAHKGMAKAYGVGPAAA